MTNLQTVAESLNTNARSSVDHRHTTQQDMASVVGDMTQQENDFSKIMARFANKPLNFADVAEVIQRRLLLKLTKVKILGSIFDREENNLTLIRLH